VRVSVLGAGSWGTTVASLCAPRMPTLIWARDPAIAPAINRAHANPAYMSGVTLPSELRATSDIEEAASDCELMIIGVPTKGFRDVINRLARTFAPPHPSSASPRASRRVRCCG